MELYSEGEVNACFLFKFLLHFVGSIPFVVLLDEVKLPESKSQLLKDRIILQLLGFEALLFDFEG